MTKPTAISLFTGCGGSDRGVIDAGFDVLMANDVLRYAKEVYLANLPETDYRCENIEGIKTFPDSDILIGCYPCQGFSQGGSRRSGNKINYLYRQFDRALRKIKPKAFIVENVSGMKRNDFAHLLRAQVVRFRSAGYRVKTQILNAADYGVPQERMRLFIVGIRSDFDVEYHFPKPTHGPDGQKEYASIRNALEGMPLWPDKTEYCQDPFHWYYLSRNRRRDWDSPSKTIVSHQRHVPLHPVSPRLQRIHTDKWVWTDDAPARRFSFREAAALQGFGRNLEFPDSYGIGMKYRVVGNAVPPQLFRAVAKALPEIF